MPMYEYSCGTHGTFEALRAMAQRASPARCPECNARAPRVLSAPRLRLVPATARVALERNERSRHEPSVASTPGPIDGRGRGGPAKPHRHRGRPWAIEHG